MMAHTGMGFALDTSQFACNTSMDEKTVRENSVPFNYKKFKRSQKPDTKTTFDKARNPLVRTSKKLQRGY